MATATQPAEAAAINLPPRLAALEAEVTEKDIPAGAVRAPAIDAAGGMTIGVLSDDKYFEYPYFYDGDFYDEIRLVMTPAAADLSRLRSSLVAVLEHRNRHEQVGAVAAAWLDGGQLRIAWVYSLRSAARDIRRDVQAGITRGLSIGANPTEVRVDRHPSRTQTGRLTFTRWKLLEATITPMPANVRSVVVSAGLPAVRATSSGHGPAVVLPDEGLSIAAAIAGVADVDNDRRAGRDAQSPPPESKGRRLRHLAAAANAGLAPVMVARNENGREFTIRVPEALLEAATSTTTTTSGLTQEASNLMDIFARAAGPAALLGVLPRRRRAMGLQQFPRVVRGPMAAANIEGSYVQDWVVGGLDALFTINSGAIRLGADASANVRVDDYLLIDNEYLRVTVVTDQANFTVARAQAGSAAVRHLAGAHVTLVRTLYHIDAVLTTVKRFSTLIRVTAESAVGFGGFGSTDDFESAMTALIDADFLPIMAAEMNRDLWSGSGSGGQVNGLINRLTAAHTTRYVGSDNAQAILDKLYAMIDVADAAHVPLQGRYFVMSRRFYRKIMASERGGAQIGDVLSYDAFGRPRLWDAQVIKDVDVPESASPADNGRCWLISAPWLPVVRYGDTMGDNVELIFDRENGTGDWLITPLALWDVAQAYDSALQMLREP